MTSVRIIIGIMRHAAILAIPAVAMLLQPSAVVWSRETVSPAAGTPAAATASRDSERCRAHANLDACYDAIRRSPRNPALHVALGDALERANHPVEAVRAYRRAAALAPNNHSVAAKISAIEAKQFAKRAPANPPIPATAAHATRGQRSSNADPVTQSH